MRRRNTAGWLTKARRSRVLIDHDLGGGGPEPFAARFAPLLMMGSDSIPEPDVTRALNASTAGDAHAIDGVLPVVYEHLRGIARRQLQGERVDHTLSPTALVHEAYLKLVRLEHVTWQGRAHFFAACAAEMRRILVSYARMKKADKRGAGATHVPLENALNAAATRPRELLALDEALTRLGQLSERQARVVECRFYAGMDIKETAVVLGTSPATVKRDWITARAWLNRELTTVTDE